MFRATPEAVRVEYRRILAESAPIPDDGVQLLNTLTDALKVRVYDWEVVNHPRVVYVRFRHYLPGADKLVDCALPVAFFSTDGHLHFDVITPRIGQPWMYQDEKTLLRHAHENRSLHDRENDTLRMYDSLQTVFYPQKHLHGGTVVHPDYGATLTQFVGRMPVNHLVAPELHALESTVDHGQLLLRVQTPDAAAQLSGRPLPRVESAMRHAMADALGVDLLGRVATILHTVEDRLDVPFRYRSSPYVLRDVELPDLKDYNVNRALGPSFLRLERDQSGLAAIYRAMYEDELSRRRTPETREKTRARFLDVEPPVMVKRVKRLLGDMPKGAWRMTAKLPHELIGNRARSLLRYGKLNEPYWAGWRLLNAELRTLHEVIRDESPCSPRRLQAVAGAADAWQHHRRTTAMVQRSHPHLSAKEIEELLVNDDRNAAHLLRALYRADAKELVRARDRMVATRPGGEPPTGFYYDEGQVTREAFDWLVDVHPVLDKQQLHAPFSWWMEQQAAWHVAEHGDLGRYGRGYRRNKPLAWDSRIDEHIVDVKDEHGQLRKVRAVALTDDRQLIEEGREMRHCVGSYGSMCVHRDIRIFSLRDPDDDARLATLAIRGAAKGSWRVDQCRGKANRVPAKWLKDAGKRLAQLYAKATPEPQNAAQAA